MYDFKQLSTAYLKTNDEDDGRNLLLMDVCTTGLLNKRTHSRGIAAIHYHVHTNMLSSHKNQYFKLELMKW